MILKDGYEGFCKLTEGCNKIQLDFPVYPKHVTESRVSFINGKQVKEYCIEDKWYTKEQYKRVLRLRAFW